MQAIQPGLFASVEVALDLSLWYSHGVVYNDLEHPLGAYARHNSTLASFSSSRREVSSLPDNLPEKTREGSSAWC